MHVAESNVVHRGAEDRRPCAGINLGGVFVRQALEVTIVCVDVSHVPKIVCVVWYLRGVEAADSLDDTVDLRDVQPEVVEAHRVQFVRWWNRVAFIIKGGDNNSSCALGRIQANLRKFVSVKLFDIFRVGPCREGQHARGEIQTYT